MNRFRPLPLGALQSNLVRRAVSPQVFRPAQVAAVGGWRFKSATAGTGSSDGQNAVSGKAATVTPTPTELLTVIQETIKTHGPLGINRYMTLCLAHPTLGYYTTRTVFGSKGDFITSPEISQIFGELLALWFVTQWLTQGSMKKVRIIELGPGKGTLLTDILRTFKALPKQSSPPLSSIHLVESSLSLREEQKKLLIAQGFGDIPTSWWGDVDEVPVSEEEFTIVVAHEFFDALPIHIFENTSRGWREVLVDIPDPKSVIVSSAPKQNLRLVLAPTPTPASTLYTRMSSMSSSAADSTPTISTSLSFDSTLPPPSASTLATEPGLVSPRGGSKLTQNRFQKLPQGSRVEISPASWEVARGIGKLFPSGGKEKGAGLVVDYGGDKAFGRSWRGFRKHQIVDPLSEPGLTDLTANVDFSFISEGLAEFVEPLPTLSQATFLNSLGLEPRLRGLLAKAEEGRKKEIESAAKRLVDGLGMGKEYRVLGFVSKGTGETYPFIREDK